MLDSSVITAKVIARFMRKVAIDDGVFGCWI